MEENNKKRCEYSEEGLKSFGKQRRGYVLGESKSGGWVVLWDGLKTRSTYAKDFIDINPLIDLYIDDDGKEKEKPIDGGDGAEITPDTILRIESALEAIKRTGISKRGMEILIKNYCGQKVGMYEIKEVIKAIENLKSHYFK